MGPPPTGPDTGRRLRTRRARRPVGLRVGRIGHTAIIVSPSWVVSAAMIVVLAVPVVSRLVPGISTSSAVLVSAVLALLLGVSVLAHELGHVLVARAVGIRVREVRLYLIGGMSELDRSPATPREEALVAGAGPAASGLVAVVCWLLLMTTGDRTVAWLLLIEMALANGIIAVFNILPALPLDGGRVLRAAVWRVARRRRTGTVVAAVGGLVVAGLLLVWASVLVTWTTRTALLQAALIGVMGLFVAAGALAEWPRRAARRREPVIGDGAPPHG